MDWDIHEASATGILNTAGTDVNAYKGKFTSLDKTLTALQTALPNSVLVREGITELDRNVVNSAQTSVTNRAGAALRGTRSAVGHYHHGQYEMAADSQRAAADMHCPDIPGAAGAKTALRGPGHEPKSDR